jgi:hypothetical protein
MIRMMGGKLCGGRRGPGGHGPGGLKMGQGPPKFANRGQRRGPPPTTEDD